MELAYRPDLKPGNILLANLCGDDFNLLRPHLIPTYLERTSTISNPNEDIQNVFFFENCIASQVAELADGARAEVGILGCDGMSGVPLLLGSSKSPHEMFIQVGPGNAQIIAADRFMAAVGRSESLRTLLLRFAHTFMIQAARTAVSNTYNSVGERLARWLLMCHDRIAGDEIALTHEFMAIMLAVRRAGVTVALHELEGKGLIRSTRGVVLVTNRAGLEDYAGSSYGVAEAEYRRLIGPFGKTALAA